MKLGHGQDTEEDLSEKKKKRWTTEMDCAQGWGVGGGCCTKSQCFETIEFSYFVRNLGQFS